MHIYLDEFEDIYGVEKTYRHHDRQKSTHELNFFRPKIYHCHFRIFGYKTLLINFLLAYVPGVENPAKTYLSNLEMGPREYLHSKMTNFVPVHRAEADIPSNALKQEDDENDYFPPGDSLRHRFKMANR